MRALVALTVGLLALGTKADADEMFSQEIVNNIGDIYLSSCKLPCTVRISDSIFELSLARLSPDGSGGIIARSASGNSGSAGSPSMIIRRNGLGWEKIFEAFAFQITNTITNTHYDIKTSSGSIYIWNGDKYINSANVGKNQFSNVARQAIGPTYPPVINPIPPGSTVPTDCSCDIFGTISLGMLSDEAVSALASYSRERGVMAVSKPSVQVMESSDHNGHSFRYLHRSHIQEELNYPGVIKEKISVFFSTEINESRVYAIKREVVYPDSSGQPDINELMSALSSKYGTPSTIDYSKIQGHQIDMVWGWDAAGKKMTYVSPPSTENQYHQNMRIIECSGMSDLLIGGGYSLNYIVPSSISCSASIKVILSVGFRPDSVKAYRIGILDARRVRENINETERWESKMLNEVVKSVPLAAPPKL